MAGTKSNTRTWRGVIGNQPQFQGPGEHFLRASNHGFEEEGSSEGSSATGRGDCAGCGMPIAEGNSRRVSVVSERRPSLRLRRAPVSPKTPATCVEPGWNETEVGRHMTHTLAGAALLALALASPARAQTDEAVSETILSLDTSFWRAYNDCDLEGMSAFFTEDVEFYHDQGGPMLGLPSLVEALKRGVCGDPASRTRREAVPGTVHVFVMHDGGKVYGAVFSGDHRFYVRAPGGPERLTGVARFTHLWLLRNGTWRMARILSYDHRPVAASE
jgi:hypothetical protein